MLFLDQGPAETIGYMIAGYVVIFGGLLLYISSLIVRARNITKELERVERTDFEG